MNSLETTIELRLMNELPLPIEKYSVGLKVQAYYRGKKSVDLEIGKTWKYYDLASMTKEIFTVPAIMQLVAQGKLKLKKDISYYLFWWPHQGVTLEDLLTQKSGLPWWKPFYKQLNGPMNASKRWAQLKDLLHKTKLEPVNGAVYSDLGFMVMGCLIEEIHDKDLDQVWRQMADHWGLKKIHFNRDNQPNFSRSQYAPTEKCPWRKKILKGEVHDDNCWALGGVSAHAGLFGSIDDVSQYGLLLRKTYRNQTGSVVSSQKLFRQFTKRAIPSSEGDWGLGFWKRSKEGSSAGQYLSPQSYGLLGFTGTSQWYDPRSDLLVTILSNRVYPTRKNNHFKSLRPVLHDIIFEELIHGVR